MAQKNVNIMLKFLGKEEDKECWHILVSKETGWINKKQHRGYFFW